METRHPVTRALTMSFTSVATTRCKSADMDTKKSKRFHLTKWTKNLVLFHQNR